MDPLVLGLVALAVLLVLIGAGIPVSISMLLVGSLGLWATVGSTFMLSTVETLPFALGSDFALVVIPMFILMGALTAATGITRELYDAAHRWTAFARGGLYYATTLASGAFGAINGSTVVSAALFTQIALPEMRKFGYSLPLSAGCICAAGTFAALIPPSVAMVLYALLVEESVGAMLMAGLLPGALTVLVYLAGTWVMVRLRKDAAPLERPQFTLGERLQSLKGVWATAVLAALVMGGIYSGTMFPSTAGAAGAAGALAIGLARRRLTAGGFRDALREAIEMTAMLFAILIGGMLLSRFLLVSGVIGAVSGFATDSGLGAAGFLAVVIAIYLVLGAFIDGLSLLVMTVPLLHPVAVSLGLDPIWFGVIVIKLIEIGAITPPVGLNLFAVSGASRGLVTTRGLYLGVLPFLVMELVTLALLILFPAITLWLPGTMQH